MINAEDRDIVKVNSLPSKMMNNTVLIRVDYDFDDGYKLKSGIIVAGSAWDESSRVARFGVVEKVPEKLVFKSKRREGMEWGTDLEVEAGDVVFFGKMASASCPAIIYEGTVYFLMNYSELIFRKRDEKIYPLNGYVLLEEVTEKIRKKGLILDIGDFVNERLGVVRYVGKPNSYYYNSTAVDADVSVGDKVVFQYSLFTLIEEEMFATMDKLGFVNRSWIIAKE